MEEEKKVIKAVANGAKKKPSFFRKFTETFVNEDAGTLKDYILKDVLIPATKKAISDIVSNGIDMILYPNGERRRDRTSSTLGYVSYDRFSSGSSARSDRERSRSIYTYDDIVLESRSEAEDVLIQMNELIKAYNLVSVADYYELVNVRSNYTDNKYGWTSVDSATIDRARSGGWVIHLPKPKPID